MHESNIQDRTSFIHFVTAIGFGLLLLTSSCIGNKAFTNENTTKVASSLDSLSFQYKSEISSGETLQVTMINESEKTITLLQPYEIYVLRVATDSSRVKTLYCPCNASCAAPSEKLEIPSGKQYNLKWKAIERWCEVDEQNAVLRIEKRAALLPGKYLLLLKFKVGEVYETKELSFFIK